MKYRVEYKKGGRWVSVLQTNIEDKYTFNLVVNAVEYEYKILFDGKDITHIYK